MDIETAITTWKQHGFVVLPGYLSGDELAAAGDDLEVMFPTASDFHGDVDPERNQRFRDEFAGIDNFPFDSTELSCLSVHPKVVSLARALLEVDDLRVYSIEAWAKYTGAADYEQPFHRDYLNHSLLVPSGDPRFEQLEMFIYLSDVPDGLGATSLVSTTRTAELPALPNWYPATGGEADPEHPTWAATEGSPELYESEHVAAGPAGTIIAYTTSTFHRGRQLTEPEGARYTIHVNFRSAAADWAGRRSWVDASLTDNWQRFVSCASPDQLRLFGFPPPGHPYWTDRTLAGVAQRYPGLDLRPWRRQLR